MVSVARPTPMRPTPSRRGAGAKATPGAAFTPMTPTSRNARLAAESSKRTLMFFVAPVVVCIVLWVLGAAYAHLFGERDAAVRKAAVRMTACRAALDCGLRPLGPLSEEEPDECMFLASQLGLNSTQLAPAVKAVYGGAQCVEWDRAREKVGVRKYCWRWHSAYCASRVAALRYVGRPLYAFVEGNPLLLALLCAAAGGGAWWAWRARAARDAEERVFNVAKGYLLARGAQGQLLFWPYEVLEDQVWEDVSSKLRISHGDFKRAWLNAQARLNSSKKFVQRRELHAEGPRDGLRAVEILAAGELRERELAELRSSPGLSPRAWW